MLVLYSYSTMGQLPVTDVVTAGLLKKIVVDNIKKNSKDGVFQSGLKALEKQGIKINENTFAELSKIQEGLKVVSDIIKSSKDVLYIKKEIGNISELYLESNINIQRHPYVTIYDRKISKKVNTMLMDDTYDKSKELANYLSDNKLKLDDYQRLILIQKLKKDLNSNYNQMNFLYKSLIREGNATQRKYKVIGMFQNKDL